MYDYPKYGTPFKQGDRYYYYYNSGLQQQYVLYTQKNLPDKGTVLLDPNTLSADGTISLGDVEFSEDGKFMAYTLSSGGSDWRTLHVMQIDANGVPTPLSDELDNIKFSSIAWTHDNKGFFYNRYPEPTSNPNLEKGTETDRSHDQQLLYHVLGQPQDQDVVVFAMPEHPTWMVGAQITDCGRFLVLYISEGCLPANQLYILDLAKVPKTEEGHLDFSCFKFNGGSKPLPVMKLVDNFEAAYSLVANDQHTFYFRTNLNAPKYRLVKVNVDVDAGAPPSSWQDVIPEHKSDVLKSCVALQGDRLVVKYMRDVLPVLELRSLSSGQFQRSFKLPGLGSIGSIVGDRKSTELFFSFTSFVEAGATYRVDLKDLQAEPELFRRAQLKVPHDPDDYETRQVFVQSKDGTKVPMFVTMKRGQKLDGSRPTLLYGYGGFNVAMEPAFSVARLLFMRGYNGVYAMANLRGGAEYGIEWRNAGSLHQKQNVFDDFQACAEWLVSHKYCSPSTLTIQGGSNGGLLVAACCNQRPDLYACVLGQVGVMDMLRFHKFTIGHAWITDYGDPDKKEDFDYIFKYSPLHNVRVPQGSGQYPAVMLSTGDHDDRVVPLHSLKLISTLQNELARVPDSKQRNPLLIRIEVRAGHGAGKPTSKIIEETADLMAFAAKCMNAKWQL